MLLCTYFLQVHTAYIPAKVCNEGKVCCHVQSVEVLTPSLTIQTSSQSVLEPICSGILSSSGEVNIGRIFPNLHSLFRYIVIVFAPGCWCLGYGICVVGCIFHTLLRRFDLPVCH